MANHGRDDGRERYWRGVLKRQGEGGLSVRAFCRRERVAESAFYFWRRTLQEHDAAAAAVPAFLPVSLPPVSLPSQNQAPAADIVLELGTGLTLRFAESASAERIATLVRALSSAMVSSAAVSSSAMVSPAASRSSSCSSPEART